MPATFEFKRGATIALIFEVVGDTSAIADVLTATAALKPALPGGGVPGPDVEAAQTFAVSPRAAAAGIGPGWDLAIAADVSAGLSPGLYATNMVLGFAAGDVVVSDPLFVRIEQSTR